MSYNGNLQQQLQETATNETSASEQVSATCESSSMYEPMLELEGAEFNEEFLKALLNGGIDFGVPETTPLSLTNSLQQRSSTASEQHSSNSNNGNFQPVYLPYQMNSDMMFQNNSQSLPSSINIQPVLPSNVATSSKRIIKPRAQLSNQEITRLLLIYMSRALASQQNVSIGISDSSSVSSMQTNSLASSTTNSSACSSTPRSIDVQELPKATNSMSIDLNLSPIASKSKRRCEKSKSTGFSGTSEPMDCSVSASTVAHRKNAHSKVRPYNSLDLPKVHDPLGLMDPNKERVHSVEQKPKMAGIGKGVMRGCSGTAIEASSSEMDLSPLAQILQTVKTVPNFETASKLISNHKDASAMDKKLCSTKEKLQEDNRNKKAYVSVDQVTPISDIFNTVNNLPNLSDIQSVLKYVQKRRAMRKLFKRRSHSAGSIDDLKKESKSSASLRAYIELLKAKSQRLQLQFVPNQPSMNDLQSCMTTHSTVTDDDFEFLRSIGIDPNTVTTKQNYSTTSSSLDNTQPDAQLQTEMSTDLDNLLYSKDPIFPDELPTENVDSQPFDVMQCPNVDTIPSELFPDTSISYQPHVLQCNDLQKLDHGFFDLHMTTNVLNSSVASELDQRRNDNNVTHPMTEIYFTPEWAHTQVLHFYSNMVYIQSYM